MRAGRWRATTCSSMRRCRRQTKNRRQHHRAPGAAWRRTCRWLTAARLIAAARFRLWGAGMMKLHSPPQPRQCRQVRLPPLQRLWPRYRRLGGPGDCSLMEEMQLIWTTRRTTTTSSFGGCTQIWQTRSTSRRHQCWASSTASPSPSRSQRRWPDSGLHSGRWHWMPSTRSAGGFLLRHA